MRKARFTDRSRTQREGEVLEACLATFSKQGCFRTTVEQVGAAVGVAKGTIYLHYPSREALLGVALDRGIQQLRQRCREIWKAAPIPAAGFRAVLTELVAMSRRRDPVSPDALSRLRCGLTWTRLADDANGKVEQGLVPLVEAWQAAGLIDADLDPLWVARVTLALTAAPAIVQPPDDRSARAAAGAPPPSPDETAQEIAERIATLLLCGRATKHGQRDGRGNRPNPRGKR